MCSRPPRSATPDAVRGLLDADSGVVGHVATDGFTALHLAAYVGRDEVVSMLLRAGADPDAVAANGTRSRPLHAATAARAPAIVGVLVDAGADPDLAAEDGSTARSMATPDAADHLA